MNNTEVTLIFFHRPSVTSTYDSAESIATLPPESDLDDEQIRNMLASPLVPTGERSKCRPTTILSLLQRKLCVKFITFPSKRGETCSCVLTIKKVESRIPTDGIPLAHRAGQGENEALSRLYESSKNDTRLIFEAISCSQRQSLRYQSRNAEQRELIVSFVNSKDKIIAWKLTKLTLDTKHLKWSKPGFMKNWRNEKEHFEKTHIRSIHEVECELTNSPGKN